MATNHPLFVHRYLDRKLPAIDSERFRVRVAAAVDILMGGISDVSPIANAIRFRAGIEIPVGRYNGIFQWSNFVKKAPIGDVLSVLTVCVQTDMQRTAIRNEQQALVEFISGALSDENLAYRIDPDGSFRYAVDEDFALQQIATLQSLDDPRLQSAREHYEAARKALNEPMDTRAAVREVFEAVEVVARLIAPAHQNLHPKLVRGELLQATLATLPGDDVQRAKGWPSMFDSFAEWVTATNNYRHGQAAGRSPNAEFAVFSMSTGSAYLRLLCRVFAVSQPMDASAQRPIPEGVADLERK